MTKYLNIIRYVAAIVVPLLLVTSPISGILVSFVVLWLNNYLDDIFFYLSGLEVKNTSNNGLKLLSPVNGIVTLVEKGVSADLIVKNDVLEFLSSPCHSLIVPMGDKFKAKYDHITIYLNKFNKHAVLNPSEVVAMYRHSSDGNVEMVRSDELVANNVGEYLNNDALIVEYKDFFMVLTMDKFISKYILDFKGSDLCCQICRGSQCDLYFKENTFIYPKEGDCVDIHSLLAEVPGVKDSYNVEDSIERMVDIAIEDAGGLVHMLTMSLKKTCATFSSLVMLLLVVILPSLASFTTLSTFAAYVGFSSLYLFLFVRSYRHLMYSLMNVTGLKTWMQKSYKLVNKVSVLWKI